MWFTVNTTGNGMLLYLEVSSDPLHLYLVGEVHDVAGG